MGDQALVYGVDRQGEALKRVGTEQRRSIVLAEDHPGRHALAVDGDPRLADVGIYDPSVGQSHPAADRALDAEVVQQARRDHAVEGTRVHGRLDRLGSLIVSADNPHRPLECSQDQYLLHSVGQPALVMRPKNSDHDRSLLSDVFNLFPVCS